MSTLTAEKRLSPDEIRSGIKKFPTWYHHWDFGHGIVVMPSDQLELPAQELRLRRIFDALCAHFGGGDKPLKGLRILDIGCNEGHFSIEAKRLGADYVLGIEPRMDKVEQARFIAQALGLDGVEFQPTNMWDLSKDKEGIFDVVLFVGVLHHTDRPLEILTKLRDITGKVMVLDTQLVYYDAPIIAVKEEGTDIHTNAFDSSLVQIPSKKALDLLLKYSGFDMQDIPIPAAVRAEWKKSKVGKRYVNGSHGTFLAFPRSDSAIQKRMDRTSHEQLHFGIFWSAIKPATVIASLVLGLRLFVQMAPLWVYRRNKWIGQLSDQTGLTPVLRKIYNRILFKRK